MDTKPLKHLNLQQSINPDVNAGVKTNLAIGKTVNVIGNFGDFQLVNTTDGKVGWMSLK